MENLFDFLQNFGDLCPKCKHKLIITSTIDAPDQPKLEISYNNNILLLKFKENQFSWKETIININVPEKKIISAFNDKHNILETLTDIYTILCCYDCGFDTRLISGFNLTYNFNLTDLTSKLNSYSFCFVNNNLTYVIECSKKQNTSKIYKKKPNDGISFNAQTKYLTFDTWDFDHLDKLFKKIDNIFLLI